MEFAAESALSKLDNVTLEALIIHQPRQNLEVYTMMWYVPIINCWWTHNGVDDTELSNACAVRMKYIISCNMNLK
jgi:hypothetical protein